MGATSTVGGSLTVKPMGDRLQALRKHLGLRQHQVETLSGVPAGRLTQIERGGPTPLELIDLLSSFYEVTPRELTDPESVGTILDVAKRINTMYEDSPGAELRKVS
jgi:transcriptional regulator with XRE-family HTH domain